MPATSIEAQILLDERHGWTSLSSGGGVLHYKGHIGNAGHLHGLLLAGKVDEAIEFLKNQGQFASFIYESNGLLVAWVDHIRSFPIFYAKTENVLKVSNNARFISESLPSRSVDPVSALEMIMAGYVTGSHTVYAELKALRPGEALIARSGEISLLRWFRYAPAPDHDFKPEDGRKALGKILDDITKDIIDRAGGRPIWVPLSAGLDSRIILAKLHEHGYRNVKTFSYGPRFNFEARHARKVAVTLGYPWRFVSVTGKEARSFFTEDMRKDFWNFADNLKALPSMREYTAMMKLHRSGVLPKDAILINGQSGDFITGGHIAPLWRNGQSAYEPSRFFDLIIEKHYDLWVSLKTPQNIEKIKGRIAEELPSGWHDFSSPEQWAAAEEIWEYDARQVTLVINGQRIYEYLGYDWELPLWEKSLVDFCQTLPLDQKYGQRLYKDYLRNDYNYQGLFPAVEPVIWRWPVPMLWVLPVARVISAIGGQPAKKKFYAMMRYFGHYSNQYAFFPWRIHKKLALKTRNIFSLYGFQWAQETSVINNDMKESLR